MKVIGLCQVYNEGMFMHSCLQWATRCVDQLIITEGCLTPHGNQPTHSQDQTRQIIERYKEQYDRENKIQFYDAYIADPAPRDREGYEGVNKNFMLKKSVAEHGDLIAIIDVDEIWHEEQFLQIVERFRKNDKLEHVPIEEYQFAYNLRTCFNAEHNGRFMRYVRGVHFGSTNHFIYPDGRDITKDYSHLVPRLETQMCHLCWVKYPLLIRQKTESFNRKSLTMWYNYVYLNYPIHGEEVYRFNRQIPPHFGNGFAEGQDERLYEFEGKLPWPIENMSWDQQDYIRKHYEKLIIR